jgi:hypothetical protein
MSVSLTTPGTSYIIQGIYCTSRFSGRIMAEYFLPKVASKDDKDVKDVRDVR